MIQGQGQGEVLMGSGGPSMGPPPSDFSVIITEDSNGIQAEDGNLLTTET
jgi:hypothetical protein